MRYLGSKTWRRERDLELSQETFKENLEGAIVNRNTESTASLEPSEESQGGGR